MLFFVIEDVSGDVRGVLTLVHLARVLQETAVGVIN